MPFKTIFPCLILWCLCSVPALSQALPTEIGGDRFLSGASAHETVSADRDVLVFGASLSVSGTVAGDVHAMGFDVDVEASVGGDIVASGASVQVSGPAGGDLTASGATLRTGPDARIGGNARLAAASVTVNGPVDGSLTAAGAEITLNAPVAGDVVLTAGDISFGPEGRIDGNLHYTSDAAIDIPARVIDAERITFVPASDVRMWREFSDEWREWDGPVALTPGRVIMGFLINLVLFILIGAVFLSLAPGTVRTLRREADARPGMVILTGVIGLSILFGFIPVSMISIVGLLLFPILLLLLVAAWTLGYILGAYVVTMRVMRAFGGEDAPTMYVRLLALATGVTVAALLNFIPVFGWLANFALVLLGIGAITTGLFNRMFGTDQGPPAASTA